MNDQTARIEWTDAGVPVSTRFDDPYFSLQNGLAETQHVFLQGNDLPQRMTSGFQVAELGFGTGLNLLATWQLWRANDIHGVLHFTSFEAFPMEIAEMKAALTAFPDLANLAEEMLAQLTPDGFTAPDLQFRLVTGDARETVPAWSGAADAWFLDGFSPAKNPELWEAGLMQAVADHTAPLGSCASYTAAGFVRRALDAAGFDMMRVQGFGRKRHMIRGTRRV